MVSWWERYSYLNNEQIKTSSIVIIDDAYDSLSSFGSRVGSKYIGYNTYTSKRIIFRSKPAPIHGPVNKSELTFSYSRIHFCPLPRVFSKGLINRLYQKVSYASSIIDPVINGFSPNEVIIHLYICDHSIITFGRIGLCLGFSNTSNVESLERFRISVVDKFKLDISILMKQNHSKEEEMKIKY